jgi:hypothetical protein
MSSFDFGQDLPDAKLGMPKLNSWQPPPKTEKLSEFFVS